MAPPSSQLFMANGVGDIRCGGNCAGYAVVMGREVDIGVGSLPSTCPVGRLLHMFVPVSAISVLLSQLLGGQSAPRSHLDD